MTADTMVRNLARFVAGTRIEDLSDTGLEQLKIRVLDSIGCALGALGQPVPEAVLAQVGDMGGRPTASLMGGDRTAPDRAALYNGTLVRYLDFNDSYLAPGETCHPSDNLGAVLAAAEYADASGRDFLAALAAAYQVQCRLSDVAPVRAHGFDHTTQGSYAAAAGVGRALALGLEPLAHAIAISGTAFNALRVTRTGTLSNWKGLAYPNAAFAATHATFLAAHGITGPTQVFEGNKGFMDSIAGRFEIDWSHEGLERVNRTIIKRFNAEIHSQSAIEATVELRAEGMREAEQLESVDVDIFQVAYDIIGGGEEGAKTDVKIKEQADHSLPYMVAVALLDGELLPAQYEPERITASDVQGLLNKIKVRPVDELSGRFPDQMPCRVEIHFRDGTNVSREKRDYLGFHSRPMDWDDVRAKYDRLAETATTEDLRGEIASVVAELEERPVRDLTSLLRQVGQ
ncbi:MAG: MmgE/PrpD family protein [Gemmatimonadetes bacterium]|uniref:MmgE/PrpD family protein n=1 Tax=Candidatus Kutchimonas denitrificans TaxID=3056748 RepID=A0AAE4ZCF9_9BACT|nr:MmgE/PrpD family protein [Gemmatimonadota bacterium]NIR76701.1 MmgE/PrpD family protein [Candidatus Kutchimonas denitrificans]NIS01188.1 MmgE/PrpD family protein [Gemmatimonadota bacterium]NIT68227.1 MmgE/PrpD family protein [Gemmatimonadota bacterium]NIW75445.1 MmgE/PrpD family protein [Gemmatimonadota bacterium]